MDAQKQAHVFKVIPLGIYGGSDESNLSSYMLGTNNLDKYVCLDAGTLRAGIDIAIKEKLFTSTAGTVLRNNIQGYLISHPHLDHVAGLIINSPDDTTKHIYGLPFCLDVIAEKYFSWKSWANFGDEGEKPLLKKYHYNKLIEGTETVLTNTNMFVTAFELTHSSPYQSTAFLIRTDSAYVVYLGDTGADEIERSTKLQELWNRITPLIKAKQLKGIFIESSFPDAQAKDKLFGHLTPALLMKEMKNLSLLCGEDNLLNVPIIITHIKPTGNNEAIIKNELKQGNTQNLQLVFPKQAKQFFL
jgi:3',5'-cyclic-nucleotide phosphodiesterase